MSKNIIFDYDGTLHNSIKIYAPAFREAYMYLVEKEYVQERQWEDIEISKWLGFSSRDMWDGFMPDLDEEEKQKCSSIIGSSMIKFINENRAELYDGTIEVLTTLKNSGYNLIFLSNCKIEYMNTHKRIFNLNKYFCDFYCTEEFGFIPKYKIFKAIKESHKGSFIVVGDRFVDIELAKRHNLSSIGCRYGFGSEEELKDADIVVSDVLEICNAVESLG